MFTVFNIKFFLIAQFISSETNHSLNKLDSSVQYRTFIPSGGVITDKDAGTSEREDAVCSIKENVDSIA